MQLRVYVLALMLSAGAFVGPALPQAAAAGDARGVTDVASLTERGPIMIVGDAGFTAENGVRSGTGTPEDPFILSGWWITGSGNFGVTIKDTTAAWIVEEVLVDSERGADFRDGFWLVNVTGGTLRHVEARNMPRYGIYLGDSNGTRVLESAVRSNGFVGLYAHQSTFLLWERNVANGNFKHGVYFANGSSYNRVTLTESYDHFGEPTNSFGIYSGIGSDHNVIDNNTLHGNVAGVQTHLVSHNIIRDNTVEGNTDRGISITQSRDTLVAGNVVFNNAGSGVLLAQSERITVEYNDLLENARFGIKIVESGDHVIRHNYVRTSETGIHMGLGVSGNLVHDNFFSNIVNVDDRQGGNLWNVSKREGRNIIGGAFLAGNYWSDMTDEFHDHDVDGLAESHGPYAVGIPTGGDYLPLVGAPGGPTAAFEISNTRPFSFERVDFTDTSAIGDTEIMNYTWEFHDGSREYTRRVSRVYEAAGDYPVTLRVRDTAGLTSASVARVFVQNLLPVPRLEGPAVITTTGAVALDASGSSDADGWIASYAWTFGDGAVATGAKVSHTYASDGVYPGSLVVVDDQRGSRALGFSVVVDGTAPSTDILIEGEAGNAGWLRGGTARLLATDDGSGVARSEWRFAGEVGWNRFDGAIALPDGRSTIHYRSLDHAGNIETERAASTRVDATPPTTTYEGPELVAPTSFLALHPRDTTSGVTRTFYQLPSEAGPRLYVGPFTLGSEPEGEVILLAWSEDAAGNVEMPREVRLTLDRSAPEVALVSPATWSATHGDAAASLDVPPEAGLEDAAFAAVVGGATLRIEASDAITLVTRVRVTVDGVVLFDASSGFESVNWTVPPGSPAWYEIVVEAWDAVDNRAQVQRAVLAVPFAAPFAPQLSTSGMAKASA